jgi:hypothetical protein
VVEEIDEEEARDRATVLVFRTPIKTFSVRYQRVEGAEGYAPFKDHSRGLLGEVEIRMDLMQLAEVVGGNAMRSRTKIVRLAGGLIEVRAENVVREKGGEEEK